MRGTIEDVLRSLKGKQALDLSNYNLDDEGAIKLANFLKHDKCVKRLNLAWNEVWAEGVRALAQALTINESLEVLDLAHNSIQTEGAQHLAKALAGNNSLRTVNLSDNDISDYGIKSLIESLDTNHTLHTLDIEGNPIFDRDLKTQLKDKLLSNYANLIGKQHRAITQGRIQAKESTPTSVSEPTKELEELKEKNRSLKKSLDKLKAEHNTIKNRLTAQEKEKQEASANFHASLQERIALEKSIVDVSTKLEREKAKTTQLAEMERQTEVMRKETQEAKDRAAALSAEKRTLRQQNEQLTKRVSALTGSADYEHIDLAELSEIEHQLESTLKTVRTMKVHRLQRKLDEALDARKCKICFEYSVNSVLMPCMHHILCEACSQKVMKCPVCNTAIQNRLHTYEC